MYPAGTLVELSSGEVAVVMAESRRHRLKPRVLLILDRDKKPLSERGPLDLRDATDEGGQLEIADSLEPGAFGINPDEIQL